MLTAHVIATECKRYARKRSVHAITILYLLLMALSLFMGSSRYQQVQQERADAIAESDKQWNTQPDRHPHRVVHFGDYAIKPLSPLSSFDWGVESYTGTTIFLEGHRQNSANFSEASQASSLLRFGQLSPAFIVQVLLPLCIIFLGFSSVSHDRESGILGQLLASGLKTRAYVFGKCLVLFGLSVLAMLPVFAISVYAALSDQQLTAQALLLCFSYIFYMMVWACMTVLVSIWIRTAYASLLCLIGLWVVFSVGMPRILSSIAEQKFPAPSFVESEMRAELALRTIGDSHNPDDPYFNAFKQKILKKYAVDKVEDMPVNYNGLLMLEGERLTTQVYQIEREKLFQTHQKQNQMVDQFFWINPIMAISKSSRVLSGTDYANYENFLRQSEQRRYKTIQQLNTLHTHAIKNENDRLQRLSAAKWKDISRLESSASFNALNVTAYYPLMAICLWLVMSWLLLSIAATRLGKKYDH
jgi:ABC-2 type transport system permease protein